MKQTKKIVFLAGFSIFLMSATPAFSSEALTYENVTAEQSELLPCSKTTNSEFLNKYLSQTDTYSEFSKIKYLLKRISAAEVEFIRNGKTYTGAEAAKFLRWKMMIPQYTNGRVKTADEFVNRVVLRSEKTGIPYQIRFPDGHKERANQILKNELELLESSILSYNPTAKLAAGMGPSVELPQMASAIIAPTQTADIPL